MGNTSYSFEDRSARATLHSYVSAPINTTFTQQKERKAHDSMSPKGLKMREARDSETHPNSLPIIIGLDVTGSMGAIPHELIKHGLPTMMAGIIQKGIPDPAVLFLAIGDHEVDGYPLQVSQFESGDAELDMWLTRTYLEGGGGGNAGESYMLAWLVAGFHTVTDSWEKRKMKGFLFTCGDEPCLKSLPASAVKEIMGAESSQGYNSDDLLEKAKEHYEVYHLHMMKGSRGMDSIGEWEQRLGDHCIRVNNNEDVAKVIANIVTEVALKRFPIAESVRKESDAPIMMDPIQVIL